MDNYDEYGNLIPSSEPVREDNGNMDNEYDEEIHNSPQSNEQNNMFYHDSDEMRLDEPIIPPTVDSNIIRFSSKEVFSQENFSIDLAYFLSTIFPVEQRNSILSVVGTFQSGKTCLVDLLIMASGFRPIVKNPKYPLSFYTDNRIDEFEQQISIESKVITLPISKMSNGQTRSFQIIDTPGHPSYFHDGVLPFINNHVMFVISAVDGILSYDEELLKILFKSKRNQKIIFVLNMIDKLILECRLSPSEFMLKISTILKNIESIIQRKIDSREVLLTSAFYKLSINLPMFKIFHSDAFVNPDYHEEIINKIIHPLYHIFTICLTTDEKDLLPIMQKHFNISKTYIKKFQRFEKFNKSISYAKGTRRDFNRDVYGTIISVLWQWSNNSKSIIDLTGSWFNSSPQSLKDKTDEIEVLHLTRNIFSPQNYLVLCRVNNGSVKVGQKYKLDQNAHVEIHSIYLDFGRFYVDVNACSVIGQYCLVDFGTIELTMNHIYSRHDQPRTNKVEFGMMSPLKFFVQPRELRSDTFKSLVHQFQVLQRMYPSLILTSNYNLDMTMSISGNNEQQLNGVLHEFRNHFYPSLDIKLGYSPTVNCVASLPLGLQSNLVTFDNEILNIKFFVKNNGTTNLTNLSRLDRFDITTSDLTNSLIWSAPKYGSINILTTECDLSGPALNSLKRAFVSICREAPDLYEHIVALSIVICEFQDKSHDVTPNAYYETFKKAFSVALLENNLMILQPWYSTSIRLKSKYMSETHKLIKRRQGKILKTKPIDGTMYHHLLACIPGSSLLGFETEVRLLNASNNTLVLSWFYMWLECSSLEMRTGIENSLKMWRE